MQPHSACSLALGHYIFNAKKDPGSSASFSIEYKNAKGRTKMLSYSVSDIKIERDDYGHAVGYSALFKRSGDPLSCRISMKVSAGYVNHGSKINLHHSTNHASGFYEKVVWGEKKITGEHIGSLKYGNFAAEASTDKNVIVTGVLKKDTKPKITFNIKMN